jgi:hypothetical protein
MPVGATQWYVLGWNTLTSSPASIGTLPSNGNYETVNYKLTVPINQPADSYTQTITFTACS